MEKFLKRHLGRGTDPTPDGGELRGSKTSTNQSKGGGKGGGNLRTMKEGNPDTGLAPLFYCKPVNDKKGHCHASDCDHRSACVLQPKRQQPTKDGKKVNHQDHFRCTITCGFYRKHRHYKTNAKSKSLTAVNSNAKRLKARKTKPFPKPPRVETRQVKVETKGLAGRVLRGKFLISG